MNLITNAAESIELQPGLITITTGDQDCDRNLLDGSLTAESLEPGLYAFLEVSDNGCGMSGETLQRIFEPFYSTKFTGRGLGMSAVMGIVKTHGGALLVESEPGRGTTFKVLFPVIESACQGPNPPQLHHFELSTLLPALTPLEMEETETDHEEGTTQQTPLSGMVLVVDDEKAVLKVCKKMVNLCGLTAVTASDGSEAVSRYREDSDKFVLVLMDLTMPNMDGMTAMNEIFSIRPDAKVIIASGYSEDELSKCITDHQPSGFIRKPYSMSVLEAEIRRVLLGQS
jgi:CheY-like chemotaxis protein